MAKVVIITPVLNGARFLPALLDSIRAQTDPDWIHYLVDGGSTDGSLDIIARAVDADRRRRVISGRDRGIYDAVFKGFDCALADGAIQTDTVCAWLGSDDLLMPWAVAVLRHWFDATGAEWMGAIPAIWDNEGRLALVLRQHYYPRPLIRAGCCNPRILGGIQQESTFFSHGLLAKVPAKTIETIRGSKLAGDALLWRELAQHADLVPIPTVVAGFRKHAGNRSTIHVEKYYREIRASGVWFPPAWLARSLQRLYPLLEYIFRKMLLRRMTKTMRRADA